MYIEVFTDKFYNEENGNKTAFVITPITDTFTISRYKGARNLLFALIDNQNYKFNNNGKYTLLLNHDDESIHDDIYSFEFSIDSLEASSNISGNMVVDFTNNYIVSYKRNKDFLYSKINETKTLELEHAAKVKGSSVVTTKSYNDIFTVEEDSSTICIDQKKLDAQQEFLKMMNSKMKKR